VSIYGRRRVSTRTARRTYYSAFCTVCRWNGPQGESDPGSTARLHAERYQHKVVVEVHSSYQRIYRGSQ